MDLRLVWDSEGTQADLWIEGADLAADTGLGTAVILSLFTDARARPDDVPPGALNDLRGWWGDVAAEVEGDEIGSRLWLLSREKELPEVLTKAKSFAGEALAWMVEDGLVRQVDVATSFPYPGVLRLEVALYHPDGEVSRHSFELFWKGA